MKLSAAPPIHASRMGSQTPELEGSPRSASHENRMTSVMAARPAVPAEGKEGAPSKP